MADFKPIRRIEGYLPIEDHGLIGDLATSALVGRDGAISWLCAPHFDSPPVFGGILDRHRGGAFTIAPQDLTESRQYYLEGTGVLVTELKCPGGVVQVTDLLPFRAGGDLCENVEVARGELLRMVKVLHGEVSLKVEVSPRDEVTLERASGGLLLRLRPRPELPLHLFSSIELDKLSTLIRMQEGEAAQITLSWGHAPHRYHPISPEEILNNTVAAWRTWIERHHYDGTQPALVRRSAITLKLLDYAASGAIVAAPTSSLPEAIGGVRNWDYRYAWIRDAAFSVYALRRIGFTREAWAFLGWVLDAVERHGGPRILYDLQGEDPPPEWEDPELEGYRASLPVRWSNGAAAQTQHDVYGEILDCAYQWAAGGGDIDEHLWTRLEELITAAGSAWRSPDHGIWEVRSSGRLFTYSVALCHVALDRGARLAERFGFAGAVQAWRSEAETIRRAILEETWDEEVNSLTEQLGGGGLDASLLALPLRRVIPADHPKMIATTKAIAEHLGAGNGLLYRYLPDISPDGLPGHEGAFLLCSFWLVDNIAKQGRLEEAHELFDSLCDRANHLGLLPEQIDPDSGAFLGNFPQAFSHIGVISSGINLRRLTRAQEGG